MGWLLENLWLAITKGYIDNRNMTLPFLLGYGLLVTCFGLCFGTPDNIAVFGIKTDITGKASWIFYFAVAKGKGRIKVNCPKCGKDDYEGITEVLLYNSVDYETALSGIKRVVESGVFA